MIIKEADDRSRDIEQLQRLRQAASPPTARRIEEEIRKIRAGAKGEEEAAYEMSVHWGAHTGRMILHDLRIEHEGHVAQIDHLVINRYLDMWVCESKHFSEGVAINEQGEFTAFFGGRAYGVASPIEQNEKHILILSRFLSSGAVKLPTRMGFTIKPTLRSLVLVSKGARITRPERKVEGLEVVIKNDQMHVEIDRRMETVSATTMAAKVVGEQTVQDLAREIAKHHKPASFNWAGKFGMAAAAVNGNAETASTAAPYAGGGYNRARQLAAPRADGEGGNSQKGYKCHGCSAQVETKVARFCWFNKQKFGGNVFCMDCQKKVAAA